MTAAGALPSGASPAGAPPAVAPGPTPRAMLAAVPAILHDPLGWLQRAVDRHGDLVAFPTPGAGALLVNHPAGVDRVLRVHQANYTKDTPQYRSLAEVSGQGLLTADGAAWREHRRLLQPAFHPERLDAVAEQAVRTGRELVELWQGRPAGLDVEAALVERLLALVGRTLFGVPDLALRTPGLTDAVERALRAVVARVASPWPRSWPAPGDRALRRCLATIEASGTALLADRLAAPGTGCPGDVLGLVAAAVADGRLTEVQARDELVTMVIAGHETVASALTWALQLLAAHPEAQDWLAPELDALPDGGPRPGDLAALVRTRAVVDEALRLRPPAWVVTRRAVAADRICGRDVPAGALVIVSPWLLHRRAADWPAPQEFRPQRFLAPATWPRESYLPFGAGPRLCIGREVALVEAVLILATLLHRARVAPVRPGRPVRPRAGVTVRPRGGLWLLRTPRAPRPAGSPPPRP